MWTLVNLLHTDSLSPIHTADADETRQFRHVGVGGVYMNLRRLPTDSAMRTHNAAVSRDPVYNSAANGIEVGYDVTYDAACL